MDATMKISLAAIALLVSAVTAADGLSQDSGRRDPSQRVQLGAESIYGQGRYAQRGEEGFQMPELRAPTTNLSDIGNGRLPESLTESEPKSVEPLPEGPERAGTWSLTSYLWKAPNTFSHPLYFEDVMLERHGHERCWQLQPLLSGTRFFATIPMLPYLAAVEPPCESNYTLGYFRAGSCAPGLCQRPPYERNAAVIEAGAIAGGFLLLP